MYYYSKKPNNNNILLTEGQSGVGPHTQQSVKSTATADTLFVALYPRSKKGEQRAPYMRFVALQKAHDSVGLLLCTEVCCGGRYWPEPACRTR